MERKHGICERLSKKPEYLTVNPSTLDAIKDYQVLVLYYELCNHVIPVDSFNTGVSRGLGRAGGGGDKTRDLSHPKDKIS